MNQKIKRAWSGDRVETYPNTLVIYHRDCPDGTCAAACVLHARPGAACVPAQYGDDPPDCRDKDVFVVDFSFPREVLDRMREQARSLRVLDHHKTAAEDLAGFPGAIFDMARSGAGLAWDEVVGGKRPWIVDYVEDKDIWNWAWPCSRAVNAWIACCPLNEPEKWLQYLSQDMVPDYVLDRGRAILGYQSIYCEQVSSTAERGTISGHNVPVVCAARPLGSQVLELLYPGEPFAARWQRAADGRYHYSLASAEDGMDVSEIAREFGGGGHAHAAGFVSDELVHV